MVRDADIEARREHRVARLEARIGAFDDDAREVDPADARKAADDLSRAGGRQCVLVVDARAMDLDRDLAGVEPVRREPRQPAPDAAVGVLVDDEGGERFGHGVAPST
jgi:hypothetical protein